MRGTGWKGKHGWIVSLSISLYNESSHQDVLLKISALFVHLRKDFLTYPREYRRCRRTQARLPLDCLAPQHGA